MTNVPAIVGLAVGGVSLVGGLFAVDGRYEHQDAAAVYRAQVQTDQERGSLETQLELSKLRLQFLLTQKPTGERSTEIDYLKARITSIESRLMALRSAK